MRQLWDRRYFLFCVSSGEEYDACFTFNWRNGYNTNVAKGAFVDIADMSATVVNLYETDEWISMLNELVALNEKGLLDGQSRLPHCLDSPLIRNR